MTIKNEAGDTLLASFYLSPAIPAERMLANMRSAIARGLPLLSIQKPHDLRLSVAGGGPSLVDTYQKLEGIVATQNGTLRWLLEHDVRPGLCAVMDAGEHIADMLVADPKVHYLIASVCDPSVFDKLKGCDVRLWHVSPDSLEDPQGAISILDEAYGDQWFAIGGGCTMGLRWIDLGYLLGFRQFDLHGLDSSFRGSATHAYPDRADDKECIEVNGRLTRPNFLAQVHDFFGSVERFSEPDRQPIAIEVFGDGLLQDEVARFVGDGQPLSARNKGDRPVIACVKAGEKYGEEYVTRLRDGVARNLPLPHDFVCFTDDPVPGVKCYPLPTGLLGWWNKLYLLSLKRPLIYFDLDVVITGDLSPLVTWPGFGAISDYLWPNMFNSSVMKLTGDEYHIWEAFMQSPTDAMKSCPGGDQQFITRHVSGGRPFPRDWFPSYRVNRCFDGPPRAAKAVVFHGQPKMADLDGWVSAAWCGEELHQLRIDNAGSAATCIGEILQRRSADHGP